MRNSIWCLGVLALVSACGPAGVISGRVTVEGGSPAGIAVIAYGPQSGATVTGDDGTFSFTGLPDGKYVLSASFEKADDPTQAVTTTVTNGAASPEPVLTFRASTAKVAGRVVMADGSEASNLTVIAVGPETRGARTTTSGTFEFLDLKSGAYVVSVEAKDTREGRVGVGVNASGSTEAIELRLTPVGRVAGLVTFNGMPAANVTVSVPGTSLSAITDAAGAYALEQVPAGPQTLLARIGSEPFWRSATAMVTVVRGVNPDVPLMLTDDPPPTGTVTGVVTFGGARSPRDITVTAPGTGVSAQPQVNGAWSLVLPVGTWDVVATAPLHPAKSLGRVTVTEGSVQALVGQELTWYRPVWRANQGITNLQPASGLVTPDLADGLPWALVTFLEAGAARLALLNLVTAEFRIVAYNGALDDPRLSRQGKYVGWSVGTTAFVYEVATGTLTPFAGQQNIVDLRFSTDETVLFIHRAGPTLTRVRLGAMPTSEIFPAMGNATTVNAYSSDRWFVREGTSVRLVTPQADVPNMFTNVSQFTVSPTWALTNCGAACELRVLSPTSQSPAIRVTNVNPGLGSINLFQGSNESTAEHPCFTYNSGISPQIAFCVKATDGQYFPLPAVPAQFRINITGTRVVWVAPNGAQAALREEAFPPGPSTTPAANSAFGYVASGWMSPTRAFAVEGTGGATRTIHLFRNGTASTETDIGTQAVAFSIPLMVFPRATPGRWVAMLGDGMPRQIDVPTTTSIIGLTARPLGTGAMTPDLSVTRYGAVSFDGATSYVLDEMAGTVRQVSAGQTIATQSLRSGATEYMVMTRGGANLGYVFNTGATLEFYEFTNSPLAVGTYGLNGLLSPSDDGRTVMLGTFQ